MSARKYIRDVRGRFAVTQGHRQQKAATKRAGKYNKAETKARQHSAKSKLWSSRLGYGNDLSSVHDTLSARQYGKSGRLAQKQKAKGYNLRGEKVGKAIGMRGVRKQARKRKVYTAAKKREGLKVQAATGVSIRNQQRARAAARKAAKST